MSKTIPYICSSQLGQSLLAGVKKVFAAAQVPVEFTTVSTKNLSADATVFLSGPLSAPAAAEVADKLSLSTRITSSNAAQWYPSSIYPKLPVVTLRNLYSDINPSFAEREAPSLSAGIVPHEPNEISLAELQREAARSIYTFFTNEARDSIHDTLKLACNMAISTKLGERTVVTVVHKPQGELATSTFDEMLKTLTKAETDSRADEFRNSSLSVELIAAAAAWPKMVVHPESIGYVVCPPAKHGEQMESLLVGLSGGSGMVAQQLSSSKSASKVYTCANTESDENPTGILLAAGELLSALGLNEESEKIVKAIEKTYTSNVLPATVLVVERRLRNLWTLFAQIVTKILFRIVGVSFHVSRGVFAFCVCIPLA
jgi:hypothetical protein